MSIKAKYQSSNIATANAVSGAKRPDLSHLTKVFVETPSQIQSQVATQMRETQQEDKTMQTLEEQRQENQKAEREKPKSIPKKEEEEENFKNLS
uniref:Uncharacterized protein n=1 Tax=Cucumis melo TaxID=3656 RepID=A0A9I9CT24_CUCME